ncbi:RNaseH domain-containing protein [Nostoc sp.]|uniref:RNaseH domain-containing protein n=1 Tax=Nostoc sp. TaxID=1180 RepID=UPI002FF7112F
MTKIILPGAWEPTATNPTYKLSAIYVPTAWRQVANNLAQQRARFRGQGYRAVPVYSLDPLIVGSFPEIIKTMRNGWQKGNVPWLLATETIDLSDLGNYIKDWLIEEFSSLKDVESQLANLNNHDWHWEEPKIYDLLHPQDQVETSNLYQAIPDYLAKEFLVVDEDNQSSKPKKAKKSEDPNHSATPMLRPKLAAPAVFRKLENPLHTILILWETPQCRDALIDEICKLLYLSPTNVDNIYEGVYGFLCIKTQHVGDLTQNLEIKSFSEAKRTSQQQRPDLLAERINKITAFLPPTKELSGALIEIRPKSFRSEADPKLAWRIRAVKAGYLNQHIHRITTITDPNKLKKSGLEPVKQAVSDLLRQFGILPDTPLIDSKKDGIDIDIWLTCFYVLRRTRKNNAENIPKTVVLIIRVNPLTAKVELTTPDFFKEQGWLSYPVGLAHLSDEDWDTNFYDESNEELDDDQKRKEQTKEQRLINKFVAECLQDCLNTPITDKKSPRVLFMAEAQNARKMLNWLQNRNLLTNDPLQTLKQHLSQEEINRLWIVRLRVAENGEVPVTIVKDSPGSRTSGVYRWQGVCDDGERSLYLSVRKPLNTEKHILRTWQSRLDNGSRQAGKARILEIALIHHPQIKGDKLAHFVHSLRSRWPYFANDIILPLPFRFAIKAKEYAVSTKDPVEFSETDDSNF